MTMNDMPTSNGDGRSMSGLIQWPRAQYWDKPWNPVVGCKHVSPACDNCYARCATVDRFGQSFEPHRTKKLVPPKNGVVFCGNMTDIFGDWNSYSYMTELVCRCLPNKDTTYLWCTKRPDRMTEVVRALCPTMTNHYFGFTVENQEWHDSRAAIIPLRFPTWANKWMSCEPLLGPIDLKFSGLFLNGRPAYDWVAVGCESGSNRRPCKIEWVESIVEQCRAARVPVFVKQLDLNGQCERDITKFPEHLRIRQVPWAKKEEV